MDLLNQWNSLLYKPLIQGLNQAWVGLLDPVIGALQPASRRARWPHDCGCDEYSADDCHCRCCISDADLLVYARVGEQRVVPIMIENSRRRERQVRLELSSWTTRPGKDIAINAQILPATEFVLQPCQEHAVTLLIRTMAPSDTGDRPDRLGDVDECTVYYADLRVEGCDLRPVRIALALLPRDCVAYQIDCRCGCC
jgi:hypothetical protein